MNNSRITMPDRLQEHLSCSAFTARGLACLVWFLGLAGYLTLLGLLALVLGSVVLLFSLGS
ncbi:MAG: hypothetical protein A2Z99_08340 [Treponema sp. GWB1_62_6]|nr:MAG: hypothetical protein A2Z99_08340 [Treponema sp. GWB1_62_6]